MNLKLAFNKYIYSSDKDIEKENDNEKKLLEKDMKTVGNAIQKVCSGFFLAALHARADWPLGLGNITRHLSKVLFQSEESSIKELSIYIEKIGQRADRGLLWSVAHHQYGVWESGRVLIESDEDYVVRTM